MSLYSEVMLPWGMDLMMAKPHLTKYRQAVLSEVTGDVLEIGFGTGRNLPHYPQAVRKITIVDPNPGMNRKAQQRIQASSIPVEVKVLSGEQLPMEDHLFDSVVSTWTLCSIPDADQALREIRRVLRPEGRFFFIEHGLSDDPKLQRWQHRLTPWFKGPRGGCHMNRDMKALIQGAGFRFVQLRQFYMEREPKVTGYSYQGIAALA